MRTLAPLPTPNPIEGFIDGLSIDGTRAAVERMNPTTNSTSINFGFYVRANIYKDHIDFFRSTGAASTGALRVRKDPLMPPTESLPPMFALAKTLLFAGGGWREIPSGFIVEVLDDRLSLAIPATNEICINFGYFVRANIGIDWIDFFPAAGGAAMGVVRVSKDPQRSASKEFPPMRSLAAGLLFAGGGWKSIPPGFIVESPDGARPLEPHLTKRTKGGADRSVLFSHYNTGLAIGTILGISPLLPYPRVALYAGMALAFSVAAVIWMQRRRQS